MESSAYIAAVAGALVGGAAVQLLNAKGAKIWKDFARSGYGKEPVSIDHLAFAGEDVARDIREKYGFEGDLAAIYAGNQSAVVHKWHHYIPIYDRYFSRFRGRPVRFLEIGVSKGGSLQMWRTYFGQDAVIFGIDVDPDCARLNGLAGQVRIGSQDDPAFLSAVVEEMGGVDVVLDDGSHIMAHVRASLAALFPKLNDGGVYLIEDMHTAYWKEWGGAYNQPPNIFDDVRKIFDDMHQTYHGHPARMPGIGPLVSGVHVHDSMIVLEKDPIFPPVHSMAGQ